METLYLIAATIGTILAVVLLIKKVETKTVFIGVGFVLCVISLKPLDALSAFAHAMTQATLLKAICASMGFAFVMKYTQCDKHLVKALTAPLKNLGFFLIPITYIVTWFVSIAIPSASGCSAAVGTTLIPLLMASGIHPAMAAATIMTGTIGGMLSPGVSHTSFVSNMSGRSIPEVIAFHVPNTLAASVIMVLSLMVMAIILKDYQKGKVFELEGKQAKEEDEITKVNPVFALMPLVPLVIIILGATSISEYIGFLNWMHNIGVAESMVLGAIIAIIATKTRPDGICKEFFNGMGTSYANIIGIIIAATVFVAGLKACGVVDVIIEWLKNDRDYVRFGGTFIPFMMATITGSGDAAAMAFNGAVTIHAEALGFDQVKLGSAVANSAVVGRYMSPISGACILLAAMAGTNTFEIVKRTALGSVIGVAVIAFVIL